MNQAKRLQLAVLCFGVSLVAACSKGYRSASEISSGSLASSSTQAQVQVGMKIFKSGNALVYDDSSPTSSLVLVAAQVYNLVLSPSSVISGLTYSLVLTPISVVNATSTTIPLQAGSNTFSVATQGDYSLVLSVTAPTMLPLTKYYTANVSCTTPTFTANSLNANSITIASAGANNLYDLSAPGITAGANGQPPYTCAWDPTGIDVIDTAFVNCGSTISSFYNNLVSNRMVSVLVKDSCNTVYTVSKNILFPYTVPGMGSGNVFISGQTSSAAGSAIGDARADNVTYLATNQGSHHVVHPSYSGSTFTIYSSQNYQMGSSVAYGININLQGLTGSVNPATGANTLSVASATIRTVSYSTDQSGDSQTAASFSGSNCTLSNQGVNVVFTAGSGCSNGINTNNQQTIEVWGHYSCTGLSDGTGSIALAGDFDGLTTMTDSCTGGGGGGGAPPIAF